MRKLLALCSVFGILSLASCSINIHGLNSSMNLDFIQKNSGTQTIDVKEIGKIEIDIAVGNCKVTAGGSGKAVVNTNCEFKAVSEEKAQKAMDNTELRCETQDDTLHISFIDSETGKKIGNNSSSVNIVTDIEVTLPDNLKSFDISTDVGDIEISGFSGAFDISSDVGNVTAKNLTITDKSGLVTDIGNIDCEISGLSATELQLKSDVGDVDLSIGTTEKSQVNIESGVGDIKIDTQGKSYEETYSKKDTVSLEKKIIADGKCTVEMKADVGDIKIK